jgi:hypothetical protein
MKMTEQRLLRYFVGAFLVAAAVLISYTWWWKSRDCAIECMSAGASGGSISISGGGRFSMGTKCTCGEAESLPQ